MIAVPLCQNQKRNAMPAKKRPSNRATPAPLGAKVNYRWFTAVLADRQMSQRSLAKKMAMDPSAVNLMLRGKRRMQLDEAAKLSKIIEEPLDEVLANAGLNRSSPLKKGGKTVPVTGWVDSEFLVHKGKVVGVQLVEAPPLAVEGLEALRCQTAQSKAEAFDGAFVYFRPRVGVAVDAVGKMCVVTTAEGLVLLRVVRAGYRRGAYNLAAVVGGEVVEDVWLISASPVVWLKM